MLPAEPTLSAILAPGTDCQPEKEEGEAMRGEVRRGYSLHATFPRSTSQKSSHPLDLQKLRNQVAIKLSSCTDRRKEKC